MYYLSVSPAVAWLLVSPLLSEYVMVGDNITLDVVEAVLLLLALPVEFDGVCRLGGVDGTDTDGEFVALVLLLLAVLLLALYPALLLRLCDDDEELPNISQNRSVSSAEADTMVV